MSSSLVDEIVSELELGMRCFVHRKDRTIISIPTDEQMDYSAMRGEWQKEIKHLKAHKKDFLEIKPMDSRWAFISMEKFADEVSDFDLQYQLRKALQGKKPFMNFRGIVEMDSHYGEKWSNYKNQKMNEWVEPQLRDHNLV